MTNYINANQKYNILAFAFTEEEKLEQYLERDSVHLILASEGFLVQTKIQTMRFCKEEGKEGIYQYQPASEIVLEIEKIRKREGKLLKIETLESRSEERAVKLIGVYSPIGRSGKTNLALALASQGESLYIGMEEYSRYVKECGTMNDICYWIRKRDEEILTKIKEGIIVQGGITKLISPFTYIDLKELTVEEYAWFFEKLKKSHQFEQIIVDIGSGCLCNYLFLGLFEQVFVPTLLGISKEKEAHFKRVLQFVGMEQTGTNFSFVQVPNQSFEHPDMREFARECLNKVGVCR